MRGDGAAAAVPPAGRRPEWVIAGRTARSAVRSGVVWGYVFGLYVASSALGYASAYRTPAQRQRLAATFGSDAGISAIAGPAHSIETVAGYTAWKCLLVLAVVGAAWGLLTSTRLLRGEEDAGRWELVLAGRTTRRGAASQGLAGLAAGVVWLWVVSAAVIAVTGRASSVRLGVGQSLFFATSLVCAAAVFLAVGALTAQLAATRRQAAGYAAAVLGASFALRMVADTTASLGWLRWTNPLGWVEELQPLTGSHPLALAPAGGLVVGLSVVAVVLAGRRDLGASTLPDRDRRRPRLGLLSGATALTVRLVRPAVAGWAVGIAAMSLLVGLVAKQAGNALTASASIERVMARLGVRGSGAAEYLGIAFLIVAVLVALLAAGQVTAARSEEADGRVEHLLVRPVSRRRWLGGRMLVGGAAVVAGGVVAGLAAWLGALSQDAGTGLRPILAAGLNVALPALCLLGLGVLATAAWPRAAGFITYGVLAWSLLVELVGGVVASNHWLLDTSVFHQMAPAPAVGPDWTSGLLMVAVGAAAALVGLALFARRDLVGA
ncbi:MAG TPA: hypothetical protein VFH45_06555 [Acidimicrobiales bacterium]|nr:hypothetical protein [Acidimicrobiales bacterium]